MATRSTTVATFANEIRELPPTISTSNMFIPTGAPVVKQNINEYRLPRPRLDNSIDYRDIDPNAELKSIMKNIPLTMLGQN